MGEIAADAVSARPMRAIAKAGVTSGHADNGIARIVIIVVVATRTLQRILAPNPP
jgi:hypothetical protein